MERLVVSEFRSEVRWTGDERGEAGGLKGHGWRGGTWNWREHGGERGTQERLPLFETGASRHEGDGQVAASG